MNDWTSIPGETPFDISWLRDKSIRCRADLNRAEAANIQKALEKYATAKLRGRSAFGYAWMLRVHRDMFGDVWKWAGQVRQEDLNLGVPHAMIGQALGGLTLDLAAWQHPSYPLLDQSAAIHHRAVHIHPFYGGNGRWSRFLANLWLRRHGAAPIAWPDNELQAVQGSIREEYLAAIKEADNHNLTPLTELHRRFGAF